MIGKTEKKAENPVLPLLKNYASFNCASSEWYQWYLNNPPWKEKKRLVFLSCLVPRGPVRYKRQMNKWNHFTRLGNISISCLQIYIFFFKQTQLNTKGTQTLVQLSSPLKTMKSWRTYQSTLSDERSCCKLCLYQQLYKLCLNVVAVKKRGRLSKILIKE